MTDNTFEFDGDDSSDEEQSAFGLDSTQLDNPDGSFLSFALGLELLHLPQVNQEYYPLKRALGPHTLNATPDVIDTWLETSITLALEQALALAYKPALAKKIISIVLSKHDDLLDDIINKLEKDLRLFFKQRQFATILPALKELLTPLVDTCVNSLVELTQEDIDEDPIMFTINELVQDTTLTTSLLNEVKTYLINRQLVQDNKLIKQANNERRNKINDVQRLETSWAYKQILEKIRDIHGKKTLENILAENSHFFCTTLLKEKIYGINQASTVFENMNYVFPFKGCYQFIALYNLSPALWQRYLPTNIEPLKILWQNQFSDDFFMMLPNIIEQQRVSSNITITRPTLGQTHDFVSTNIYQYLAYVRLYYRDLKRRIRQIADENNAMFDSETLTRSWQFNTSDKKAIETLTVTKNGAATQLVVNLGSYKKIHDKIRANLICINTELQKNNADQIGESFIAYWMLQIIQHANHIDFKYADGRDMPLSPATKKCLTQFLTNFTYLIFGCEVIRNPAALISNMLVLELIRENTLSWKDALNQEIRVYNAPNYHVRQIKYGGGAMPMSMGSYKENDDEKPQQAQPVQAARTLQQIYSQFRSFLYGYPGDTLSSKEPRVQELKRRQEALVTDSPDVLKQKILQGYGL